MTVSSRREISTARSRKAKAARTNAEETLPVLTLAGDFASRVTVVPRTNSALLMGLGTLEASGRRVMVPFLEMVLAGTTHGQIEPGGELEDDGLSEVLSCVLSMDNAIWMQFDLVRDTRRAIDDLTAVVNPEAIEGARLSQALRYAERLRDEADKLVKALKVVVKEP